MTSGGDVHICWRQGDTSSDPTGYMHSRDYGKTWGSSQIAIDTDEVNHPFSLVADAKTVHVLTGPLGAMKYAYGRLAHLTITSFSLRGGEPALAWESNQKTAEFSVQSTTDLKAGNWSLVEPASQWPIIATMWTRSVPDKDAEFFRVVSEEK